MGYSFSIKAKTKDEAVRLVVTEFDKVVKSQSIHAADQQSAVEAARAFIALLREPSESEHISLSMYGSLGWRGENEFTSANVSVSAALSTS